MVKFPISRSISTLVLLHYFSQTPQYIFSWGLSEIFHARAESPALLALLIFHEYLLDAETSLTQVFLLATTEDALMVYFCLT